MASWKGAASGDEAILVWVRIAVAVVALSGVAAPAQADAPIVELAAGMHRIEAEVASTPGGRAQGLMKRDKLAANGGMLFVFPEAATHCMWMRNTYIPLSVAFLDDKGTIINIADMQPESDENHCARKPARYALEMNIGWFRARGIAPGARISGIGGAPAPR